MNKKIVSWMLVLGLFFMVGCSSKSNDEVSYNDINNENLDKSVNFENEYTYEELLESGKTYENMNELEREEFDFIVNNINKFTEEFRNKYDEKLETIKLQKEEIDKKDININEEKNDKTEWVLERENLIGISDKNFKSISKVEPGTVRNDRTGNWRLSRISTYEDILEYVKSYYEENFKNDNEIHAIVNFTLNTTTRVSKLFDNVLSVTILEYVDKEELDAGKLFGGDVLGDYWVYLDNGDIEKVR